MMSKEAMKLAWEAEEKANPQTRYNSWCRGYEAALREALAKPDFWEGYVPEPVKPRGEATLAQQEPVHQFRKSGCSDWYDGHPDHTDGGGPYEARTLYTSQLARHGWTTEQIAGMVRLKESQDKKLSQRKWVGPAEQEALDKMAENARELGLDYEPAPVAEPRKQEPVVWMYQDKSTHEVKFQKHMRGFVDHGATYETPLYITPPQRTWVGLTDEERFKVAEQTGCMSADWLDVVKATETALQIKNQ